MIHYEELDLKIQLNILHIPLLLKYSMYYQIYVVITVGCILTIWELHFDEAHIPQVLVVDSQSC